MHLGANAGQTSQGALAVAVGNGAGSVSQGVNAVAVGSSAGINGQGADAIAIGYLAADGAGGSQKAEAIAIGHQAAGRNQGTRAVAVGAFAGDGDQGDEAVGIGYRAGADQRAYAVAVGSGAGASQQNEFAIAIGRSAGAQSQGTNAIAIGRGSGGTGQGAESIAIGYHFYTNTLGANAISIGSRASNINPSGQPANSIIINATGAPLLSAQTNASYVTPIRAAVGQGCLKYDAGTFEITFDGAKTFVIDHPIDPERYLVHACLEGPESGVYYRGEAELKNGETWVELPAYVSRLARNLTVQLTQINSNRDDGFARLRAGHITGQGFPVYGDACQFAWHVFGTRADIQTEPLRAGVVVQGDGPYRYIG